MKYCTTKKIVLGLLAVVLTSNVAFGSIILGDRSGMKCTEEKVDSGVIMPLTGVIMPFTGVIMPLTGVIMPAIDNDKDVDNTECGIILSD